MEKENREIIDNAERGENNTEKKEQPDKKKTNRKKKLFMILSVIILLCIGIMFFQETGVINKHVHIKIEDITEREEVCYDNLIFSFCTLFLDNDSQMWKSRHLCIFNTGDVYYLELPRKLLWLSNSNEYRWEEAENVIYMGRLSNSATETLNQYINNYDDDESYIVKIIDPGYYISMDDPYSSSLSEAKAVSSSEIHIYWQGDDGESRKSEEYIADNVILYFGIGNSDHNIYETWRTMLTREENAIAAIGLFESTGFYYRWVSMCFEELSR